MWALCTILKSMDISKRIFTETGLVTWTHYSWHMETIHEGILGIARITREAWGDTCPLMQCQMLDPHSHKFNIKCGALILNTGKTLMEVPYCYWENRSLKMLPVERAVSFSQLPLNPALRKDSAILKVQETNPKSLRPLGELLFFFFF